MSEQKKLTLKAGQVFSCQAIQQLFKNMSGDEKNYSVRARSSTRMVDGKMETEYTLFLRNGSESIFERLDNWWNAKLQRDLAKALICSALELSSATAAPGPGEMPVNMRSRRQALSALRKLDKFAPESVKEIFLACDQREKRLANFEKKLLNMSSDERMKFGEFGEKFGKFFQDMQARDIREAALNCSRGNDDKFDSIKANLAEAAMHCARSNLQEFKRFAEAIAENGPLDQIDLGLMLEMGEKGVGIDAVGNEEAKACSQEIDVLLKLCANLPDTPPAPPSPLTSGKDTVSVPAAPVNALPDSLSPPPPRSSADPGKELALVLPGSRSAPPAPGPRPQGRPLAWPVLPAGLFQSLLAGRQSVLSGAALGAVKPVIRGTGRIVPRSSYKRTVVPRRALPAPRRVAAIQPILPAPTPRDIRCDLQAELDLSDVDKQAVVLMADEGGMFSMSPTCQQWLSDVRECQHRRGEHFTSIQHEGQVVLLAQPPRPSLHQELTAADIAHLKGIYEAAVQAALDAGRPVCLTDLFDGHPETVDPCVEAMLAPIRRCYQNGLRPAVQLRVTSQRVREKIIAALNTMLEVPPQDERPAVEVIDKLTETDMRLPGMVMVTAASASHADKALRGGLERSRKWHFKAGAAASPVSPRRSLGENTATHLYYFAQPCPLKGSIPDGALMSKQYAAFFQAAREHDCKLVTIEVLAESPGNETILAAAVSAAIADAHARTPDLKVRVLTRNPAIRAFLQEAI